MDFDGEITETPSHEEVLRYCNYRSRRLSRVIGPRLNSVKRAIDSAFFRHGFYGNNRKYGNEINPGWDKPEWDRKYIPKGEKTEWNALHLCDRFTYAYRINKRKVRVYEKNKDYS
jgi:hypothetical protein